MWFYSVNIITTCKYPLVLKSHSSPMRLVLLAPLYKEGMRLREMKWPAQDHRANKNQGWDFTPWACDSKDPTLHEEKTVYGSKRVWDGEGQCNSVGCQGNQKYLRECQDLKLGRQLCRVRWGRVHFSIICPKRKKRSQCAERGEDTIRTQEGAPRPKSSLKLFCGFP